MLSITMYHAYNSTTTTHIFSIALGGKSATAKSIKVAMANAPRLGPADQLPSTAQIDSYKKSKKKARREGAARGRRVDAFADVAQLVAEHRYAAVSARAQEQQLEWDSAQQQLRHRLSSPLFITSHHLPS